MRKYTRPNSAAKIAPNNVFMISVILSRVRSFQERSRSIPNCPPLALLTATEMCHLSDECAAGMELGFWERSLGGRRRLAGLLLEELHQRPDTGLRGLE